MPTPCTIIGTAVAGMPICWATETIGSAAIMNPAIPKALLRIVTSLLCCGLRGSHRRFSPGQNVVQIVVRGQAFGGQHVDGAIDRHADDAALLVHIRVRVQD